MGFHPGYQLDVCGAYVPNHLHLDILLACIPLLIDGWFESSKSHPAVLVSALLETAQVLCAWMQLIS
jgi:hypothetical protein